MGAHRSRSRLRPLSSNPTDIVMKSLYQGIREDETWIRILRQTKGESENQIMNHVKWHQVASQVEDQVRNPSIMS